MKNVGLAILIGGIALCASYGARLSPEMRAELSTQGKAKLLGGEAKAAFEAWCAAGKGTPAAKADGCPAEQDKPAEGAAPKAEKKAEAKAEKPKPTVEALVAEGRAKLAGMQAGAAGLDGEPAKARAAWVAAFEKQIEPSAQAAVLLPTPPGTRVSAWFAESGVFFLIGLALVLAGAIMARKAVKAEALSDKPKSGGAGPVDFGVLLGELRVAARGLADEMTGADGGDRAGAKAAIEAMQHEQFAPLVEARGKLQARYGLAGYAEVFGPFSGAERRINRAWSALVDEHWPEARDSVLQAAEALDEAVAALERVVAQADG